MRRQQLPALLLEHQFDLRFPELIESLRWINSRSFPLNTTRCTLIARAVTEIIYYSIQRIAFRHKATAKKDKHITINYQASP